MILKFTMMVWFAFTGTVAWAQLQFVPVTLTYSDGTGVAITVGHWGTEVG